MLSNTQRPSLFIRFFNVLIDTVVISIIVGILSNPSISPINFELYESKDVSNFLNAIPALTIFAYYLSFEYLTGRTLGKLLTGTKVTTSNGCKPSFYDIFLRTIVRFIPFFDAFSFVWSKAGLHDKWSETKLIYSQRKKLIDQVSDSEGETNFISNKSKAVRICFITPLKGMKLSKNFYKGLAVICIVLVLTNPSKSDFNSFLHISKGDTGRDFNFFVASIYSHYHQCNWSNNTCQDKYLAVLGNFFKINN